MQRDEFFRESLPFFRVVGWCPARIDRDFLTLYPPELLQRLAGPTADAELEAFEIVDGLIVGVDWAMAGAAIADATIPVAATLRNSRRFMGLFPHSQA